MTKEEALELEKIKQEPRPVIAYDNLMQILRIMENEAVRGTLL